MGWGDYGLRRLCKRSTHLCWLFACSCLRMLRSTGMDDLMSLVDTLLLLSTLMAGFSVALMTGSSVSNDDHANADSFNFRATFIDNNLEESKVKINSHVILMNGQLSSVSFFSAIAFGVTTYLNLNLSRAREDRAVGERFSLWFTPVVLVGYLLFFVGLSFFFMAFQGSLEAAFPIYCTDLLYFPVDDRVAMKYIFDAVPASGSGGNGTGNMLRVGPQTWEYCHDRTFAHSYYHLFRRLVVYIFFGVLALGFVLNVCIDLYTNNPQALKNAREDAVSNEAAGLDGHPLSATRRLWLSGRALQQRSWKADNVAQLRAYLEQIDPSLGHYADEMHAANIRTDQFARLGFHHLQAIGVKVGDALRIMDAQIPWDPTTAAGNVPGGSGVGDGGNSHADRLTRGASEEPVTPTVVQVTSHVCSNDSGGALLAGARRSIAIEPITGRSFTESPGRTVAGVARGETRGERRRHRSHARGHDAQRGLCTRHTHAPQHTPRSGVGDSGNTAEVGPSDYL